MSPVLSIFCHVFCPLLDRRTAWNYMQFLITVLRFSSPAQSMMLVTRGGHESFSPLQLNPIRSLVERSEQSILWDCLEKNTQSTSWVQLFWLSGSALKLARNNLFHTKTMSPLAVTYNDKSVLENMHVASAFQAMVKETLGYLGYLGWLSWVSPESWLCCFVSANSRWRISICKDLKARWNPRQTNAACSRMNTETRAHTHTHREVRWNTNCWTWAR